jgi:hypothetical protein
MSVHVCACPVGQMIVLGCACLAIAFSEGGSVANPSQNCNPLCPLCLNDKEILSRPTKSYFLLIDLVNIPSIYWETSYNMSGNILGIIILLIQCVTK